jgi:hypothetical protein
MSDLVAVVSCFAGAWCFWAAWQALRIRVPGEDEVHETNWLFLLLAVLLPGQQMPFTRHHRHGIVAILVIFGCVLVWAGVRVGLQ